MWVTWQWESGVGLINTGGGGNLVLNIWLSKLCFETVSNRGVRRTLEKTFSPAGKEPLIAFHTCLVASLPFWDEMD